MNLFHEIIGTSWLAFFVVWAVLAIVYGGNSHQRNYSSRAIGIRLLLFVGIVIGVRYSGHIPMPQLGAPPTLAGATGVVLCIAGLLFATWARVVLGRNWGMPMTVHDNPQLITSGPYHYVRHPIYTGLIAMWIGTALDFPPSAIPGACIIAYTVFSAVREERNMEQRFPAAYPEYKQRSKMLLPFLI